eukprot:TRINITY_DN12238_c0_g1_i1.p1 TRINITY_DN12238_c0_g1~~TRINITY_DN12238_c0_g1_i1.p1  ORF type:complete len:578 (+),score=42.99 TRINITY_DN12238_c0_g1_i1:169-1902(+)
MLRRLSDASVRKYKPAQLLKHVHDVGKCKNLRWAKVAVHQLVAHYPLENLLAERQLRGLVALLTVATRISYQLPGKWEYIAVREMNRQSKRSASILTTLLALNLKRNQKILPDIINRAKDVFWNTTTADSQRIALLHAIRKINPKLSTDALRTIFNNSSDHQSLITDDLAANLLWIHSTAVHKKTIFSPCRPWVLLYRKLCFSERPTFSNISKLLHALTSYDYYSKHQDTFDSMLLYTISRRVVPELNLALESPLNINPTGFFYNAGRLNYKELSWLLGRLLKVNFLSMEMLLAVCRLLEQHALNIKNHATVEQMVTILKGLYWFDYAPESVKESLLEPVLQIKDVTGRPNWFIEDLLYVLRASGHSDTGIHTQLSSLVSSGKLAVPHTIYRYLEGVNTSQYTVLDIIYSKELLQGGCRSLDVLVRELYLVGWVFRTRYPMELVSNVYQYVFRVGNGVLGFKKLTPRSCRMLLLPLAWSRAAYPPLIQSAIKHLMGVRDLSHNTIPEDYKSAQLLWAFIRLSWINHSDLINCLSASTRRWWHSSSRADKYCLLSLVESLPPDQASKLGILGRSVEYH